MDIATGRLDGYSDVQKKWHKKVREESLISITLIVLFFGVGKPDRIFVEDFEEMRRNFVSREQDSGMLKFTNKKFASL